MSRYFSIASLIGLFLLVAVLGWASIAPAPAYAQDMLQNAPDLSGINIYFSEVNDEYSRFDRSDSGVSRFAGLLQLMGANLYTLEWRRGIPENADLVIIPAPGRDMSADMVARLWVFMEGGGKVLVVTDVFDHRGDVSRALGERGLFELTWNALGVRAREDAVVLEGERRTVEVTEVDRAGNVTNQFSGTSPVLTLDFMTRRINPNHAITNGLFNSLSNNAENATSNQYRFYFDGARSLEVDATLQRLRVTPLIFTENPTMYGESNYAFYHEHQYAEYNAGEDSDRGDLILAAAIENPTTQSRLALIGDGDFIRNGAGFATSPVYSGSFIYPANVQFMVRTVAWLLGETPASLDLPTPAPTATATATITPTPLPTATPEAEEGE